ncbi:MAG: potassium transporter TrkG [bacterium]
MGKTYCHYLRQVCSLSAADCYCVFLLPRLTELTNREGFAIATFGWITAALFGSLPFIFAGVTPNLIDAFFESMSGFTTTGATLLSDIEAVPRGILFWRSFTHWLGGMGIIVLSVAIVPRLGAGGLQLFKAEVPGSHNRPVIAADSSYCPCSLFSIYRTFPGTDLFIICGRAFTF